MKKKLIGALLVAAMTVTTLAGCGGTKDNTPAAGSDAGEKTDSSTEAASNEETADGDETLTVWCWDPTFNVYAMQQAEAMYQKDHPNFKLDIQEKVYTDIEQSLITAAEAGNYDTLPDIFLMQDNSFSKNATNYPELFTDLTDSGIDFDQFSGGKLADSTVDGAHYGIPFDNGATIMAIRSDMVEKAGLTVEDFKDTTWSEFMDLAKKVVDANGVPMLTSSGGSEIVIEMLQSAGASPMVDGKVNLVDNAALKEAISVYKELIETGIAKPEDVPEFGRKIHGEATRMIQLVNDILQLSHLDSASETNTLPAMETVDLLDVAKECVERQKLNAQRSFISLTYLGESARVLGNRGQLDELCQNLCDNAIRYNRPGGKVQLITACTRDGHCTLTVKDDGIGIPLEAQSSVFERFYRVDKSRSKATGGTGLGLAIVKHIARIHNARIKLESEVDVGTTITVTFETAH